MPAPKWMIEGLFEANSLVMLAGPSYSFKSFMLLDWLLSMATGRKWLGRNTQTVKIAYALGEGKASLLKRVQAWVYHHDLDVREKVLLNENFKVTFDVPQLATKVSNDGFLADLAKENFKPDIVAVDTFARSMVGKDENNAKDTGEWVDQADRLRQLGYTVIFLHHTKKNTEFGVQYRGSSAIIGAMDTAMTLQRDKDFCTLTVTKQKDHDEGPPLRFKRLLVPTGEGEESCVLVPTVQYDERFAPAEPEAVEFIRPEETVKVDDLIKTLQADPSFPSNRARGRALARMTGMSEDAGTKRIERQKPTGTS